MMIICLHTSHTYPTTILPCLLPTIIHSPTSRLLTPFLHPPSLGLIAGVSSIVDTAVEAQRPRKYKVRWCFIRLGYVRLDVVRFVSYFHPIMVIEQSFLAILVSLSCCSSR